MKRCSKCILPDTIPNLTFDEQGVCNRCKAHDQPLDIKYNPEGLTRRLEQAREYRRRVGVKYDVLVPVSGGRDSSFIALDMRVNRKLDVLCVNYTNPFSSVQAGKNVEGLVKRIGADLATFTYPHQRHEKSFETNLRAWLKNPSLATMGLFCLACKPMYLEFFKMAEKHKISLIVDGSNPNEVADFKLEAQAGEGAGAGDLLSAKSLMTVGKKVLSNLDFIRPSNIMPALTTLMSINGDAPYLKLRYRHIEKTGYFYWVPYDEAAVNTALAEVGWEKAKDNNSPWRFDCEIDSLKNLLYYRLIGATEKDELFSKNIRDGMMTREEAMSRLGEGDINMDVVERVLRMVNLTMADIDRALPG